jgi:tRNA(Arg) A34 adenosine deaminase TadA
MALVHSRIRRVIYEQPDESRGALGSRLLLHELKQLNHHYEVRLGDLEARSVCLLLHYAVVASSRVLRCWGALCAGFSR